MRSRRSVLGRALAAVAAATIAAGCSTGTEPAATPSSPAPSSSPPASSAPSPSPSAPSTPLRLSVLGDVGAYDASSAVLDDIASRDDDLALVVGDLSYGEPGAESRWCDFVTTHVGRDYPVEIVSGNHDDDGPNGAIEAFTACLPNRLAGLVGDYGRQWYVDLPATDPLVRVVMISPALDFGQGEWSYDEGSDHYDWTRDAVRSARDAGIPWVVAGMHKPCLSVGVYDCDPGADLTTLLVREGVDLVVAGHEHMYQRTAALALGAHCPRIDPGTFRAGCVATSGGTTFVTVGTGGQELRDASADDAERPYFEAISAANEDPAHGSLEVTVTPEELTSVFRPVRDATFTDSVTLAR